MKFFTGDGLPSDRRGKGADPAAPSHSRDRAPRSRRRDRPPRRRPRPGPAAAATAEEAQAVPQGPDRQAAHAADSRHHRVIALIQRGDGEAEAGRLAQRVLGYRIFPDASGKMNLSLQDIRGQLLAIPQFTLAADTDSGARPSFSRAASPDEGQRLFLKFVEKALEVVPRVATGRFGAQMRVSLVNDGPVTFWLRVPPKSK